MKAGTVSVAALAYQHFPQFPKVSIEHWRNCFKELVLKAKAAMFARLWRHGAPTEGVFHQQPGAAGGAGLERADVTTGRQARSIGGGFKRSGLVSGPVEASESGFSVSPRAWAAVRRREDLESLGGWCPSRRERMALSTTVSQKKLVKRKAPRGFLKRVFKQRKPHLRLETNSDLLVRFCPF